MSHCCMIAGFSKQSGIGVYSDRLWRAIHESSCDYNVSKLDWNYSKLKALFMPFVRWRELRSVCKCYDVVHVQYHLGEFMFFFLPLLFLLSWGSACKIFVTVHEDSKNLSWLIRAYEHVILTYADRLIVHSEAQMCDWPVNKVRFIPMGCDVKKIDEINSDKNLVVIPGFINEWKGHDVAMRALAELKDEYPKLYFVFAGKVQDKVFYDKLKVLEKDLGLGRRMVWIEEYVSKLTYDMLMASAGLVLLPYRRITMSAVLCEAIGMGKNVLASRLPAFESYPGVYSFGDGELVEYLRFYLNGGFLGCDIERVREFCSWSTVAMSTVKEYQNF